MKIIKNFNLSEVTTFHLPAKALFYVEYETVEQLKSILESPIYSKLKRLHIGGGSNLLFTSDFDGLILHSAIKHIDITNSNDVYVDIRVGAGVNWDYWVKWTVDHGFYGAENLSYIPGEVGASAIQNVGAYGVEAKDIIHTVHVYDTVTGIETDFQNEQCLYGYRHSIFKHDDVLGRYIVTAVTFRLSHTAHFNLEYGPLKELAAQSSALTQQSVRNKIIEIRKSKLPEPDELGSAGSFFKNPVIDSQAWDELHKRYPSMPFYKVGDSYKIPAGWLIETAGLKGKCIGGAQVYPRQCLVIVNTGNATATDVVSLFHYIQHRINEIFGIKLSPEVNVI